MGNSQVSILLKDLIGQCHNKVIYGYHGINPLAISIHCLRLKVHQTVCFKQNIMTVSLYPLFKNVAN